MTYSVETLKSMGYVNQNAITGRIYEGLTNQKILAKAGYDSPGRLTFYQAMNNNLRVKKGSKGTKIIYREQRKELDETGQEYDMPYKKTYTVFNIEQCETRRPELMTDQSSGMRIEAVKAGTEQVYTQHADQDTTTNTNSVAIDPDELPF